MAARPPYYIFLVAAAFVCACGGGRKGPPPIGEAYAGPATLNLRQELAPKSPVVATVKHGAKLEVIQVRRRFVRVRTSAGALGWTDSRQLLSTAQMEEMRQFAQAAAKLPSQGAATVFEALNIHAEPNRGSPSLAQIPANGSVDVIGHRLAPKGLRSTAAPTPLPVPKPTKSSKTSKKTKAPPLPPPPLPAAPPVPSNWLDLSRRADPEPGSEEAFAREAASDATRHAAKEKEEASDREVPMEDWSLVKTREGRVGWVLSRLLTMAIPDEVAQYAEGHRITSYFALADIRDDDQMKHIWLWTTAVRGGQPYEFDSFRVFTWNLRRHRYETAHIERNLVGYYPVEARKGGDRGEGATFSLIVAGDGGLLRKVYSFNGYRVRLDSKEPYQPLAQPEARTANSTPSPLAMPQAVDTPGLLTRIREQARALFK